MILILLFTGGFNESLMNGSGSVVLGQEKKAARPKDFTLNFKDADITEFITLMSELIGKNIIVDDNVRGKITMNSNKSYPISEAFNIFRLILEIKGFSVIETPNLLKVIPTKTAIKKNETIIIDGKKQEIPANEANTVTEILSIDNTDANEIANTLRALKSNDVDLVVHPSLNLIIFSGLSSEIKGLIKIANELDRIIKEDKEGEKIVKGNIQVVHLENADAEQLAGVLSRIPFSETALIDTSPQMPSTPAQPNTAVRPSARTSRTMQTQQTSAAPKSTAKLSIIANKETNSLIITARPEEFKEIERIIKELDIVREQVLIEALIVEISADKTLGFGIDWMYGNKAGSNLYGGSQILGTPPSFAAPSGLPSGKELAMPLAEGFQLGIMSGETILAFALLNLKETDKNFNILSTPQILTIDNHEAELNVGEERPVTTNTRITDQNTVFNTFEYKSVGIKLKITPHITRNERITLDLYQEANDVQGGSAELPILTKRDIQTKVTVNDGKTIVIGGMIKNYKSIEENKVPFLGDIPILGWLFKRQDISYRKTNLLVFITPHIVTKQEKMDAITEQKQEEQKRLKLK